MKTLHKVEGPEGNIIGLEPPEDMGVPIHGVTNALDGLVDVAKGNNHTNFRVITRVTRFLYKKCMRRPICGMVNFL